ncbi:serine/threonine protein phosphatase, partial [Streptomyces sp. LNU-CPARS28]
MTEHLSPYEGRKAPVARPTAPADPRGALLRAPETDTFGSGGVNALPAQARTGEQGTGTGSEHAQSSTPATEGPGSHRPRPAPEGVPTQPHPGPDAARPGTEGPAGIAGVSDVPGAPGGAE